MKKEIKESNVIDENVKDSSNKKSEEDGIKISPNHGLNASMQICPICEKNIGIVLHGRIDDDDSKAPVKEKSFIPCEDCQKEYIVIASAKKENENVIFDGRRIYIKRNDLTDDDKEKIKNNKLIAMETSQFNKFIENIKEQEKEQNKN